MKAIHSGAGKKLYFDNLMAAASRPRVFLSKTCSMCKVFKSPNEYQRTAYGHDGMTAHCKSCASKRKRVYYIKNRDFVLAASKANASTAHGIESGNRAKTAWIERNPSKTSAHRAVAYAIRTGLLAKQPCEKCGSSIQVHAHHDDYSQKLQVRWLCPVHHVERHRELRMEVSPCSLP